MTLTLKKAASLLAGSLMVLTMPNSGMAKEPLRICAEPDNLPFSNEKGEGFENKIASVLAKDLGMTLEYTFLRERKGFLRQTLNANRCDVVIGVPAQLERVRKTQPYYRSTYAIVTRKDRHLDLKSYDDPAWVGLKVGLHTIGDDGSNSPPAHVLGHHHLGANVVGYPMWGAEDQKDPQGDVVKAVAEKKIDAAIVWGPFAGYFAKPYGQSLVVRPAPADPGLPDQHMAWDITMAVRKDDEQLQAKLNQSLERQSKKIQQILKDYHVPFEPVSGAHQPAPSTPVRP
jgi:quinoprotein dehydrogenase-associated probable ABC transporter substrate-binding protein